MRVWARLKPGVNIGAARQQMKGIGGRIARAYPTSNKDWSVTVDLFQERAVGDRLRSSLWILLAAVAAVLLIACVNLANLLLVRASAREREVAIRSAIGAKSWRLLRQFLVESILLAFFGGCAGVAIAIGLMRVLKLSLPPFYLPSEAHIALDLRALFFMGALVLITGVLFGIAPALQVMRVNAADSLKEGSRSSTTGASGLRLRSVLIVSEVALAFVLLSSAGLLIRSFYQLQQVDTGFDSTNVITTWLPMDDKQYTQGAQINEYYKQILDSIQSVPGIRDVATTSALPLQGWGYGMPFQIAGKPVVDVSNRPGAFFKMVSASYFRALGMRLRKGRGLSETDTQASAPVAVINETMVAKYFKDEDPIGKRILIQKIVPAKHELGADVPWQIVGVVADEKVGDLDDSSPGVYVPVDQSPSVGAGLVIRGNLDPTRLMKSIERAVWQVNKNQALSDTRTLEQVKSESLGGNRLRTYLLLAFAAIALLLAAIGLFGVISYTVNQRTHELGLRAALGASSWNLLQLVVRHGLRLTALGLFIGVAGSLALTHLLKSLLFEVSPRDPLSLVLAGLVLALVAAAASFIPASGATRVDPMIALRYE